jgi:gliding motility-associated-like protein
MAKISPFVPKYFTPNNDGFNDVWQIKEMGDYLNSRGRILTAGNW